MRCKYCNQEMDKDVVFCTNCGKKQDEIIDITEDVEEVKEVEEKSGEAVKEENMMENENNNPEDIISEESNSEQIGEEIATGLSEEKAGDEIQKEAVQEDEKTDTSEEDPSIKEESSEEDKPEEDKSEEEKDKEDKKEKNKKSKKVIIWSLVAIVVIIIFLSVLLKLGETLDDKAKHVFTEPSIGYKNNDTYAIIDDQMFKIDNDLIEAEVALETDNFILLSEKDRLYVYSKEKDKTLDIDDVKDFKISFDGEHILVLNTDDELSYGEVLELENLREIQDNVKHFASSMDLEWIFIQNKDNVKLIDNDGDEADFEKEDVLSIGMEGNRYFVYITDGKSNEQVHVYDVETSDEVFEDSIEKKARMEIFLLKEDGSILVKTNPPIKSSKKSNERSFFISPEKQVEIKEKVMGIRGIRFDAKKHYTAYIAHKKPEEMVLITKRKLYNLENFKDVESETAFEYGAYLTNLKDDNVVEILDSLTLNPINSIKLDLYDDEEVEYVYSISDRDIYVKTNLSFYYYNEEEHKDLKLHKNDVLCTLTENGKTDFYIIDEDMISFINGNSKEMIYDGQDVMDNYIPTDMTESNQAVFLDRDENLYSIKNQQIEMIAEGVDSFTHKSKNRILYKKGNKLFIYHDGESTELGEKLDF